MEIGNVKKVNINEEMQHSYLDYAMSVIVSRALPDARDGLKPVQRRILYAMHDMGIRPDSDYKKSARIVGEVLGKYHPHGDMAVYDAMARLGQDFSMRYMLVDGQGNFGSVDGDPPAAMRYTEARLKAFTMELMNQIDRNTVDFIPNFDETLKEPVVLPAGIPNLLVNGASGIAVGMATNIPPHNLGEVVDALSYMLEKWEKLDDVNVQDLMHFIKGPDFPTGGILLQENQENDLLTVYATGRGRVIVRGQVHIEEMGRGRSRLIITELPYMTNKSSLIEKIAELVRNDGLEGIADLRDESDRHGMRIVIELGKGADEEKILRELYRRTQLQSNFGINLLALINGEPHLMTLKQALKVFLDHRLQVIERRSRFDLEKARQRAHILEGLRIALKHLEEIIKLIRNSADTEDARLKLMKRYTLSEVQANAILDMPLKRLAALERKKIEMEYQELEALIRDLEALLASPKRMRQVVEKELIQVKESYNDRRRTQIISLREGEKAATLLTRADMVPAETVWVGITKELVVGRTIGDELPRFRGSEAPGWLIKATTNQTLYLVSKTGKTSAVAIHSLPEVEHFASGQPLGKVSAFRDGNELASVFVSEKSEEDTAKTFVVTISKMGMIKKSLMSDLPGPSGELFTLAKVNDDDELGWVVKTNGSGDLFLVTKMGMGIRFSEEDVRPMGLVAAGVNGLKLAANDLLAGAGAVSSKDELLLLANDGMGWRMAGTEFPRQGRYGQGVAACKQVKGSQINGLLIGSRTQMGIIHLEKSPARQIRLDVIPAAKRSRAGHEVVELKSGDAVVGITPMEGSLEGSRTRTEPTKAEQPKLFGLPDLDVKAVKPAAQKPGPAEKTKTAAVEKTGRVKKSRKAEQLPVKRAAPAVEKIGVVKKTRSVDKPAAAKSTRTETASKLTHSTEKLATVKKNVTGKATTPTKKIVSTGTTILVKKDPVTGELIIVKEGAAEAKTGGGKKSTSTANTTVMKKTSGSGKSTGGKAAPKTEKTSAKPVKANSVGKPAKPKPDGTTRKGKTPAIKKPR
jgi:DNA gyrase subunit A